MVNGCIYCGKDDGKLLYSEETDAHLHLDCLEKERSTRPRDPEIKCLEREFAALLSS